jgi:predicted dehydrogenase
MLLLVCLYLVLVSMISLICLLLYPAELGCLYYIYCQDIIINHLHTTVVRPSQTHPDIILYGIASRDLPTAQKATRHYGFRRAYGCYQDLLDDPAIDIVYLSTPNFEWATSAILQGKHVLCEKPFASNVEEARQLVEMSKAKGVIVEEAVCFYLFPPVL